MSHSHTQHPEIFNMSDTRYSDIVCDAGGRWRVSLQCNVFINMLISHYPERRQRLNGDQQLTAQRFKPEEMIVCWFKFTERWEPAQLWTITHSFSFYISNVLWQPKLIWNMKHVRLSVWGFITCMCVFAAAELLSRRLSVSVSSNRTQVSSSAQLRLFFVLRSAERDEQVSQPRTDCDRTEPTGTDGWEEEEE